MSGYFSRGVSSTIFAISFSVSFDNLYSLRAPVGTVEGLDLSVFDRMVRERERERERLTTQLHTHVMSFIAA